MTTTMNIYEWLRASVNACEWLWMTTSIYEHEWLWASNEHEWLWDFWAIYDWERKVIYDWKQGMKFVSECEWVWVI
jgi:hypothetical protein